MPTQPLTKVLRVIHLKKTWPDNLVCFCFVFYLLKSCHFAHIFLWGRDILKASVNKTWVQRVRAKKNDIVSASRVKGQVSLERRSRGALRLNFSWVSSRGSLLQPRGRKGLLPSEELKPASWHRAGAPWECFCLKLCGLNYRSPIPEVYQTFLKRFPCRLQLESKNLRKVLKQTGFKPHLRCKCFINPLFIETVQPCHKALLDSAFACVQWKMQHCVISDRRLLFCS